MALIPGVHFINYFAPYLRLAPNFWEAFYWCKSSAQGASTAQNSLWNWPQGMMKSAEGRQQCQPSRTDLFYNSRSNKKQSCRLTFWKKNLQNFKGTFGIKSLHTFLGLVHLTEHQRACQLIHGTYLCHHPATFLIRSI